MHLRPFLFNKFRVNGQKVAKKRNKPSVLPEFPQGISNLK